MESVKCSAEKFVTKTENSCFVLIKHIGKHKCMYKSVLESQVLEEMETYFETNPTATRSEAIVHHLVQKINFGTKQDVIDLVSISLNIWEINNAKAKGIRRLNPHGSKMDAVRHLKAKLHEIGNPFSIILKIFDDIYICSICNAISESSENTECVKVCTSCSMTPMEHIGPAVFISSRESLSTLRELSKNGSLSTEACCLDHQPSRLRQYTTFAGYAYDLDLRRMCPLFASVMTSEKELAVYHCLDVVDRCMAELFETDNYFNPNLIISDEASSIKNAVKRKLGAEKINQNYGTCQLHYMGSVLQHCSFVLGNKVAIWQFMKLSQNLMNAETPIIYDLFKKQMQEYISKTEQRYDYLFHWFEFYDERRTGWSRAYRNPELPKTNKGEAGNSHYSAVTHLTGLTLDLGVKCMISEFHVYAGCKRGIVTGLYKGGKGPSRVIMEEKMVRESFNRIENTPLTSKGAEEFVSKILEKLGLKETEAVSDGSENQSGKAPITKQRSQLQTHRYLAQQMKARTEARNASPSFINTPHKAPKKNLKRKIQFSDTLADLQDDDAQPKKKMNFGKSLNEKILNTLTEGVTVLTVETGVYQLTINNDKTRCYTVNFKENPTCTCPQFKTIASSRPRRVCKHISVMMLYLGFTFSSKILRKPIYNATERMWLTLKLEAFKHSNVDILEIKRNFEKEMNPTMEVEKEDEVPLPYFNSKKYYGQYKTFKEAKVIIEEQTERYPIQWFGVRYSETRYTCTSASHTTADSNKLRQKLSKAKPLVFLVYFTRIFQNPKTGKFSARDEKKYFHMQSQCISNLGQDPFSNIKPPFNVDITRLSKENKAIVRTTFPDVTFVEDI